MKNRIKKTDKDYIVIVNHPALQKRAEELGYQDVNCFPDTLTKSESRAILNELAVLKKTVLMILFRPAENSFCDMVTSRTIASGNHLLKYELSDKEMASGRYADTIEEAITLFPLRERMEKRMMNSGYIQSTDFEERCGNCRAYLEEDDKYCKYCGTKRGEGAFLPYNNHGAVEVVYGPPCSPKQNINAVRAELSISFLQPDQEIFCFAQSAVKSRPKRSWKKSIGELFYLYRLGQKSLMMKIPVRFC